MKSPRKKGEAGKTVTPRVVVHPDIHKQLAHEAIDTGTTIQERAHVALCHALGLEHLILQTAEAASR